MSAIAVPLVRPSISTSPIEPEDLLLVEDKGLFELVDGRLVEKKLGYEENKVAGKIARLIGNYAEPINAGDVLPEQSFQCFPRNPKQVRRPDVAFIAAARVPKPLPTGNVTIIPDLAVEVVSPNDAAIELEEKLLDYQSAGIPLVWVVYPTARVIRVHTAHGPSTALLDGAVLSGDPVLPGFAVNATELFSLPVLPSVSKPQ